MLYLILAYGDEKAWNALSAAEQTELLAQDEVLRERGDVVAAVQQHSVVVRAWDGTPTVSNGPFAIPSVPLAGFGIIEAADLDEVVRLVAKTPCARTGGAIEIRAISAIENLSMFPTILD